MEGKKNSGWMLNDVRKGIVVEMGGRKGEDSDKESGRPDAITRCVAVIFRQYIILTIYYMEF